MTLLDALEAATDADGRIHLTHDLVRAMAAEREARDVAALRERLRVLERDLELARMFADHDRAGTLRVSSQLALAMAWGAELAGRLGDTEDRAAIAEDERDEARQQRDRAEADVRDAWASVDVWRRRVEAMEAAAAETRAAALDVLGGLGEPTAGSEWARVRARLEAIIRAPGIDAVINLDSDPLVESVWRVESDGAPIEEAARHAATEALVALREAGLTPERVLADPDGGVALYLFGDETIEGGARARYVRVAASNDETLTVLCVDRETSERTAWDASSDLGASLVRVAEFLG